jgi:hypothetical protein
MTVDIFGYDIDLEILILIGVMYLIIIIHTFISVAQLNGVNEFVKEGFEALSQDLKI